VQTTTHQKTAATPIKIVSMMSNFRMFVHQENLQAAGSNKPKKLFYLFLPLFA
jgi:hypothetical protein